MCDWKKKLENSCFLALFTYFICYILFFCNVDDWNRKTIWVPYPKRLPTSFCEKILVHWARYNFQIAKYHSSKPFYFCFFFLLYYLLGCFVVIFCTSITNRFSIYTFALLFYFLFFPLKDQLFGSHKTHFIHSKWLNDHHFCSRKSWELLICFAFKSKTVWGNCC